jgi:hypothetical protein
MLLPLATALMALLLLVPCQPLVVLVIKWSVGRCMALFSGLDWIVRWLLAMH